LEDLTDVRSESVRDSAIKLHKRTFDDRSQAQEATSQPIHDIRSDSEIIERTESTEFESLVNSETESDVGTLNFGIEMRHEQQLDEANQGRNPVAKFLKVASVCFPI
jgi:hypothetical protein